MQLPRDLYRDECSPCLSEYRQFLELAESTSETSARALSKLLEAKGVKVNESTVGRWLNGSLPFCAQTLREIESFRKTHSDMDLARELAKCGVARDCILNRIEQS